MPDKVLSGGRRFSPAGCEPIGSDRAGLGRFLFRV